jgi:predicted metal-binding membrane protein
MRSVSTARSRLLGESVDRTGVAIIATLIALAGLAWMVTGYRMAGMDAGPGSDPGALGFFLPMWVVMMVAMMFPSSWPMVAVYARLQVRRRELGRPAAVGGTALFVAGYLLTWTGFGLLMWVVYQSAARLTGDALAWNHAGRWLAGGAVLVAAVYELTPAKYACLRRCRGPLSFLLGAWRDGAAGALRMGVEHGAWCVGCCWALMVALFTIGVMSVPWMVFIAALIAAEKLLPWRRAVVGAVTLLLVALALGVTLVPERVPGLNVPGSSEGGTRDHGPMGESGEAVSRRLLPSFRATPK